jgi:hypothetical protein
METALAAFDRPTINVTGAQRKWRPVPSYRLAAGADGAIMTSHPSLFDRQISASMRFQGRAARA